MLPILFAFSLTLSAMDATGEMYSPPDVVAPGIIYGQAMDLRLSAGPVFVGGELALYDWMYERVQWWPNRIGSKLEAGLDFGWLELGYEHRCQHPVTPWKSFVAQPPEWEGWHDMVYVRIKGEAKIRG